MEETEKFGVKVVAENTDEFKKQMQDLANTSKKTSDEIKNNLKVKFDDVKSTFDTYSNVMKNSIKNTFNNLKNTIKESYGIKEAPIITTDYDKQIELLEGKINDLISNIERLKEASKDVDNKQDILEAEAELEKLNVQIRNLYDKKIDILDWEQTEQYIENLSQKLLDLKEIKESLESGSTDYRGISLTAVEQAIERVKFQIETAKDTLVEFNEEGKKTNNTFGNLGKVVSKGFQSANRNIKRLALSMVGVHSAYYVLSRAISTYQQYDIETTQKMKSAWASLGAFLAPIVQTIGTLVQKAVGYLNVFITALTGTNYIQKANDAYKYSKSIKEIGKSASQASKSLTAMDEITNIPEAGGGGGVGGGLDDFNPFEALENVELNQEWVKKIQDVAEALKPVYETIKDIIKWCTEHPEVIAGMLGGMALLSLLGKVIGYAGTGTAVGTGLAGVLGVLLAIAGLTIITISIIVVTKNVSELVDINKKVQKSAKKVQDQYDELLKKLDKYIKKVDKNDPNFGKNKKTWITLANQGLDDTLEKLKEVEKLINKWKSNPLIMAIFGAKGIDFFNWATGNDKRNAEVLYTDIKSTYTYIEALGKAYDQGKLNEEETKDYKDALQRFKETIDQTGYGVEGFTKTVEFNKDQVQGVDKMYEKTTTRLDKFGDASTKTKDKVKTNTEEMTKDISKVKKETDKLPNEKNIKINVDAKRAGTILGTLGNALTSLNPNWAIGGFMNWVNQLKSYDVGTPYVPEDGLAMIHKGERIIPAKYNNESLFNNTSNETTNALLIELIQAVEETGDKVPVFNINGKEFAKATYNDYRNEENRLNQSQVIRRM